MGADALVYIALASRKGITQAAVRRLSPSRWGPLGAPYGRGIFVSLQAQIIE